MTELTEFERQRTSLRMHEVQDDAPPGKVPALIERVNNLQGIISLDRCGLSRF